VFSQLHPGSPHKASFPFQGASQTSAPSQRGCLGPTGVEWAYGASFPWAEARQKLLPQGSNTYHCLTDPNPRGQEVSYLGTA
jgi:hypothetical protein